jgi:hypothetical protein
VQEHPTKKKQELVVQTKHKNRKQTRNGLRAEAFGTPNKRHRASTGRLKQMARGSQAKKTTRRAKASADEEEMQTRSSPKIKKTVV